MENFDPNEILPGLGLKNSKEFVDSLRALSIEKLGFDFLDSNLNLPKNPNDPWGERQVPVGSTLLIKLVRQASMNYENQKAAKNVIVNQIKEKMREHNRICVNQDRLYEEMHTECTENNISFYDLFREVDME